MIGQFTDYYNPYVSEFFMDDMTEIFAYFLNLYDEITSQHPKEEKEVEMREREDGSFEEGHFVNGCLEGFGKITFPNKKILKANFIKGKAEGKGTLVYIGKKIYEGEFKGGEFNGEGTITYINGETLKGTFSNNSFVGTLTFPNGTVYDGTFQKNPLNKNATITESEEIFAESQFKNGVLLKKKFVDIWEEMGSFTKRHFIKGKIKYPKGISLDGEFKNGFLVKGHKFLPTGERQDGEFRQNALVQGMQIKPNGDVYEGEFKYGVLFKGKFIVSNGAVHQGEFKDGKLIRGKTILTNGEIIEKSPTKRHYSTKETIKFSIFSSINKDY